MISMVVKKSALMKRLIFTIFSLYFILAVVVSAVHIFFEYDNIRHQIAVDLESIYTSSSDPLSTAIWNFNSEQITKVVEGLVTLNFISGVDITGNGDDLNTTVGHVDIDNALIFKGPIIYKENLLDQHLGTLTLYADHMIIIDRIRVNVIFIIANAFIKTFFLSLIILTVGNQLIGKPLAELVKSVRRLNLDSLEDTEKSKVHLTSKLHKKANEITELIDAYNQTLDKLYSRTKQRDEARQELEDKNLNLEEMVSKKTIALQDKVSQLNDANQRLEILANTDSLTGLLNRRYFFERSAIERSRLRRNNNQAGVLIIDVDFFKSVNDNYGHPAGDAVLVVISKILKDNVRQHDLVARFGGEEFAILLVDVDIDHAITLAERMRKNIERQKVIYKGNIIKSTASFGLSMLAPESDSVESALAHADKLLYAAKEDGRNNLKY